MPKTPTTLKWLAEKRARLAGDIQHCERLAEDIAQRLLKLQHQLAALDETIRLYDAAIDPTHIQPVEAWRNRYGTFGGFRQALIDIVEAASPDWVASKTIELGVLARLGINFQTSDHRRRWRMNSLGPALRRLLKVGTLERLHDPAVKSGKHGYWRLKQAPSQSLADL
ncbi:hypothetical protein [Roseateles sp.]|uniref:hypothetical protein n=1 Tax=Roseateles sp. TaxID=1971397 RepID=UPI0025EEE5FA|nr:hypothetical protein [Roseateles sp.]MBV8037345.1 hypothetical protein [Roseateles sp.]